LKKSGKDVDIIEGKTSNGFNTLRNSRVVYDSYSVLYFLSLYRANKKPLNKYDKIKA